MATQGLFVQSRGDSCGPRTPSWMPRISAFHGIVICMYWYDHPPPHFHASNGEFEAVFTIGGLEITEGGLPIRKVALVREWPTLHQAELLANWELAQRRLPLNRVPPLE